MRQAKCTGCNQVMGVKKTWKNETVGEFTVCDNCGERIILERANATNVMEMERGTIFHVEKPRRISKREMRRRINNYVKKNCPDL